MTHVNLDGVNESVRQFILAVTGDPAGSVLELNGRPVAWVLPAVAPTTNGDEAWSERTQISAPLVRAFTRRAAT